jgi:capsular polysaccharide transport system permease protein
MSDHQPRHAAEHRAEGHRAAEGGKLRRGLQVQIRCINALIMRDLFMRFGRSNIGFLWVILEPMILTLGVMGIWSLIKSPYEHGLQIVAFVFTGYMPLTLWRHMSSVGVMPFRRSISVLYHRNISLIDAFLSRIIVEFCGTTAALLTIYGVLTLSGSVAPMADPGLVALAWLLMALLSMGLASVFAVATEYSEVTERFIQPFQYLMLPLSGTFYMIDWLPSKAAQDLIWYNPTVHCYEMFRAGFFGDALVTHHAAWYPALWGLALLTIGMTNFESVRDRLQS